MEISAEKVMTKVMTNKANSIKRYIKVKGLRSGTVEIFKSQVRSSLKDCTRHRSYDKAEAYIER